MSAALPAFGTLVAWGEVLTMLGSPRTVLRDPARRALCAAFAGPAIGFTLAIPQVRAWLPLPLEHSPLVLLALLQGCCLSFVTGQQVALAHWQHAPRDARMRARRHVLTAAGVQALLTLLLLLLGQCAPSSHTTWLLYVISYTTVVILGGARIGRCTWQYAKAAGDVWLRRGLTTVAISTWLTLISTALQALITMIWLMGAHPRGWGATLVSCSALGLLCIVAGWRLPGVAVRLTNCARWLRGYVQYQRLRPLWTALYQAVPTIALETPAPALADRLDTRNIRFRLYRRVIEIRDAQLTLRSHHEGSCCRSTSGGGALRDEQRRAEAEARRIKAALVQKPTEPVPDPRNTKPEEAILGSGDLREEAAWLVRVSRELAALSRE